PIYEGTTGIQSLDLLGRKVTLKGGEAMKLLAAEMMETIQSASKYEELRTYAAKLGTKMQLMQKVMGFLTEFAKTGDYERFLSDANLFMEFFSNIVIGWLWLDMAVQSKEALVTGNKDYSEEFYESKIHAMRFYFKYELVKTISLSEALMDEDVLTIATDKKVFV
ncbi:MAG: acyl-CoA dehydrogenase, partial [Bacteroidota bacterium]